MKLPVFISQGNMKMTLPTFSIPAGKTCPGCTKLCGQGCYAKKAERAWPSVALSRKRNLEYTKRDGFVARAIEIIKRRDRKWFRIHESGDFYNQKYLDKWLAICRGCPEVRFLAFTKSFHLDFTQVPSNLQIIWSVWPDTKMETVPPGPRAYAGESKTLGEKLIECPGQCDTCMVCWGIGKVGLSVHFHIH
jgi:hypothetical protein